MGAKRKETGKHKTKDVLPYIFPYDPDNVKTHPWLTCKVSQNEDTGYITSIKWIKNPDFEYGHLIKGY